jgi:MFS family permease
VTTGCSGRAAAGQKIVSQIGSEFTVVALLVQVYDLTHSSAAVGLIGAVQLVPMVLVSIGFGPQIDRRDRRVLLIGAQFGLMTASSLLLLGALQGHPPLALVYGAAALNAAFVSVSMPTRAAMTPNLVPPACWRSRPRSTRSCGTAPASSARRWADSSSERPGFRGPTASTRRAT